MDLNDAHDAAIFGGEIPMGAGGEMSILSFSNQPLKDKDTESLMHPNVSLFDFFCNLEKEEYKKAFQ